MVCSLAACGSSTETTETAETVATEEAAEATEEAEATAEEAESAEAEEATAVDASEIKIGIVTDTGGVNDGSFNESAWAGAQKAAEEFGLTANYLESHACRSSAATVPLLWKLTVRSWNTTWRPVSRLSWIRVFWQL